MTVYGADGTISTVANAARDVNSFRHTGGSSLEAWYYCGSANGTALTTGAPTANVLRAIPFVAPVRGGTLDRIAIITTAGVAGNARFGIYTNKSEQNLYPASLVVDSGDKDMTGNAVKSANINISLTPGALYWAALVGAVAPTIRCFAVGGMNTLLGVSSALGTAQNLGISVAYNYAALPSTFSAGGAMITAVPLPAIAIRYSA